MLETLWLPLEVVPAPERGVGRARSVSETAAVAWPLIQPCRRKPRRRVVHSSGSPAGAAAVRGLLNRFAERRRWRLALQHCSMGSVDAWLMASA
jgi:hypothetical protein